MAWVWLLLFVIFIIVEAHSFNLITIWFAVGALGALIVAYITDNVLVQFVIFTIVTTLSLMLTRPLADKFLKNYKHVKTNLDSVIGEIGIVEVEIKPNTLGRVTVLGKDWAAKSDKKIKVGSKVEILNIEGVKLVVKEKDDV